MKYFLFLLAFVLLVSFDASAQRKRFTPVTGKYAVIDDSLRVGGTTTLNGILDYLPLYCAADAFTTTAKLDTVVITGLLSTDKAFVSFRTATAATDSSMIVCMPGANGDTLFVTRTSGVLSAAAYQYLIIR